jgi:hypothetical protein
VGGRGRQGGPPDRGHVRRRRCGGREQCPTDGGKERRKEAAGEGLPAAGAGGGEWEGWGLGFATIYT